MARKLPSPPSSSSSSDEALGRISASEATTIGLHDSDSEDSVESIEPAQLHVPSSVAQRDAASMVSVAEMKQISVWMTRLGELMVTQQQADLGADPSPVAQLSTPVRGYWRAARCYHSALCLALGRRQQIAP